MDMKLGTQYPQGDLSGFSIYWLSQEPMLLGSNLTGLIRA